MNLPAVALLIFLLSLNRKHEPTVNGVSQQTDDESVRELISNLPRLLMNISDNDIKELRKLFHEIINIFKNKTLKYQAIKEEITSDSPHIIAKSLLDSFLNETVTELHNHNISIDLKSDRSVKYHNTIKEEITSDSPYIITESILDPLLNETTELPNHNTSIDLKSNRNVKYDNTIIEDIISDSPYTITESLLDPLLNETTELPNHNISIDLKSDRSVKYHNTIKEEITSDSPYIITESLLDPLLNETTTELPNHNISIDIKSDKSLPESKLNEIKRRNANADTIYHTDEVKSNASLQLINDKEHKNKTVDKFSINGTENTDFKLPLSRRMFEFFCESEFSTMALMRKLSNFSCYDSITTTGIKDSPFSFVLETTNKPYDDKYKTVKKIKLKPGDPVNHRYSYDDFTEEPKIYWEPKYFLSQESIKNLTESMKFKSGGLNVLFNPTLYIGFSDDKMNDDKPEKNSNYIDYLNVIGNRKLKKGN